jgi:FtsP/CotA-like multicopper oxidase with cupredoxin domain
MSKDRTTPVGRPQVGSALRRGLAAVSAAAALIALMPSAQAQGVVCPPISQPLVKIPEIVSENGVLRGTVMLQDVQLRMLFRIPQTTPGRALPPGTPGAIYQCLGQTVRGFRGLDAVPPVPPGPFADPYYPDPVPGPTLRARVGDIVELTLVNQLDPNRFGATHDDAPLGGAQGCDTVNVGAGGTAGYPYKSLNPAVLGDAFPDCFHGSSSGNIHFHGSHTNTDGTGDNVFLELRPSPRDANNKPTIGPDTYTEDFIKFFAACEHELRGNPLAEWPSNWDQAPLGPWQTSGTWLAKQMSLLDASDHAENIKAVKAGVWPQYYIGAYPYCFQLPTYTGGVRMGQAPGTHWYHAHKHGSTAIDVANGMVGAFIIEGQYDDDLNAFYGQGWTRTQPVLVINQLGVEPNLKRTGGGGGGGGTPGRNDKGPDFSVNGRSQPIVTMAPGEVQLWRIVNGSGRSGMFLSGFPPAFNFRQIAQDGVQFADENYKASQNQSILIAAGNRADLLVKAPLTPGIYPLVVQHEVDPSDLASARPVVLLQMLVPEGVPPVTGPRSQFIPNAPKQPDFLKNIADGEVQGTRTVKFATPVGPLFSSHTVNGYKFGDGKQQPVKVTLNTVEEWKVMNYTFPAQTTAISHPFHIHLNPFQIVEVFDPNQTVNSRKLGQTVPKYVPNGQVQDDKVQCGIDPKVESTWKDCHNPIDLSKPQVWWDVFPIPSGNTYGTDNVPGFFRMRSRFVDFPGQYVIHCHILAHEDRGMMAIVQLVPAGAPAPMLMSHH